VLRIAAGSTMLVRGTIAARTRTLRTMTPGAGVRTPRHAALWTLATWTIELRTVAARAIALRAWRVGEMFVGEGELDGT